MPITRITAAQTDALRWVASPLTVATPRRDVLCRLHRLGLAEVTVRRVVRGTTGTARPVADYAAELTAAGRTILADHEARTAAR